MGSKAGVVALLGMPNAGKSTLFNRLLGMPLAGVTPKPQTTRFLITGILNHELGQAILVDTPGVIAQPRNAWHQALNRHSYKAAQDADVLLYLISLREVRRGPLTETLWWPEWLSTLQKPLLIGVTHADELPTGTREAHLAEVASALVSLSPRRVLDVAVDKHLDELIQALFEVLPESPPLYPTDEMTPQSVRFFVAEIIRKYLYMNLQEELPYGTEVEVETYREKPERDYIAATIYVEKESHKPMVIGRGGAMIKKIGTAARKEIEALVGKPVFLELYVKVAPDWRKSTQRLRSWGYEVC
jgi:GTP-binding protein Era